MLSRFGVSPDSLESAVNLPKNVISKFFTSKLKWFGNIVYFIIVFTIHLVFKPWLFHRVMMKIVSPSLVLDEGAV